MNTNSNPSKRILLLIALASSGLVGNAIAADTSVKADPAAATATGMPTDLSRSERKFLEKAYEANQQEIALSRLASDRAANPQVREYAKELASKHAEVDTALQTIVNTSHARLETDAINTKAERKLSAKTGADFDEAYLEAVISHHKKAVDLYEDAAEDNKNPQIRTFAAATLPTLRDHLTRAQQLEKAVD